MKQKNKEKKTKKNLQPRSALKYCVLDGHSQFVCLSWHTFFTDKKKHEKQKQNEKNQKKMKISEQTQVEATEIFFSISIDRSDQ